MATQCHSEKVPAEELLEEAAVHSSYTVRQPLGT